MKNLFAFCLCFVCSNLLAQSQSFTLTGTFLKNAPEQLIISYNNNNRVIADTIDVRESKFLFSREISHPVIFFVKSITNNKETSRTQFFIDFGGITIVFDNGNDINSFKLTGSKTQNEHNILFDRKEPLYLSLNGLREQLNANQRNIKNGLVTKFDKKYSLSTSDSLSNLIAKIKDEIRLVDIKFFNEFPKSLVSLYTLNKYLNVIPKDSLAIYFDKMDYNIKNSAFSEPIKFRLTQPDIIIGSKAFAFSSIGIDGKLVKLNDFKGKSYVLLDFWASWCIPCREGNPKLKETYNKYKHLGFEIIGISDDTGKEKFWRQAVNQDGIGVWKHVLRGTAKDIKNERILNDLNKKYAVNSLPTKILINKDGYIIDIFKSGDERLDSVLGKLFLNR